MAATLPAVVVFVAVLLASTLVAPRVTFAQTTHGFATVDLRSSHTFTESISSIGLGGARDLFNGRIAVGGQADFFLTYAMRVGPFVQINLNRNRSRVFLLGGYAAGENAGSRIGVGVELLPRTRPVGFRLVVQRYSNGNTPLASVEMGLTWK